MLADTRLITNAQGRHQAQAQRFEIMFADGSTIGLHPVIKDGQPSMFLRCLRQGAMHLVVFDLRDVNTKMDEEIRKTHQRDVPGLVFYTLRQQFTTASQAAAKMISLPIDVLIDVGPQELEAEAA